MELSFSQKIARLFSSKSTFEKMKEESQRWTFICPFCKKESTIWDIGGIRYKYKATGDRKLGAKCPHCQKFSMQSFVKK